MHKYVNIDELKKSLTELFGSSDDGKEVLDACFMTIKNTSPAGSDAVCIGDLRKNLVGVFADMNAFGKVILAICYNAIDNVPSFDVAGSCHE